jgi:dual-specificity kinase
MSSDLVAEDRFFGCEGDMIGQNYRIIEMCGEGTFSNVYKCKDIKNDKIVVIKVCRSSRSFEEAAQDEVEVMKFLQKVDPEHNKFVPYIESFKFKEHTCIVLELLGPTLYESLKFNKFRPFSVSCIRSIMKQVVGAVAILHRNEKIHTDLKLENILLKKNLIDANGFDVKTKIYAPDVRLADFGSIDTGRVWHTHLATTSHYRAPEILLGLKWGYEADIWSIGCILVELSLGNIPFYSRDTLEHLFLIQQVIEDIPRYMWDRCTDRNIVSRVRRGRLPSDVVFDENKDEFCRMESLRNMIRGNHELTDLVCYILRTDPAERPYAEDILRHPFFRPRR